MRASVCWLTANQVLGRLLILLGLLRSLVPAPASPHSPAAALHAAVPGAAREGQPGQGPQQAQGTTKQGVYRSLLAYCLALLIALLLLLLLLLVVVQERLMEKKLECVQLSQQLDGIRRQGKRARSAPAPTHISAPATAAAGARVT